MTGLLAGQWGPRDDMPTQCKWGHGPTLPNRIVA